MKEFIQRTVCPDPKNKAYVSVKGGGKNHCILGNPDGRVYEWSVLPDCTGYGHGRAIETIGSDDRLCRGNAENYWAYTQDGFRRGQTPQVGSIMCWRKGKAGNSKDGAGHVAFVEEVNAAGDVIVSQSAWSGTKENKRYWCRRKIKRINGTYSIGAEYRFQGFIYLYDPVHIKPVENAVYRLYNPNGDEHMFTYNIGEANSLSRAGWVYEGIGWYAPTEGAPVYRLYNTYDGDHVLTVKEDERDKLTKIGWKYEGIAFRSDEKKEVPVYRVYNRYSGEHFYTKNKAEINKLVDLGWKSEGIAFYGMKEEKK